MRAWAGTGWSRRLRRALAAPPLPRAADGRIVLAAMCRTGCDLMHRRATSGCSVTTTDAEIAAATSSFPDRPHSVAALESAAPPGLLS